MTRKRAAASFDEPRIASTDDALAVLARAGAMTIVPTGRVPSLVGGIVGGPVRGSWWSHPEGKRIFRIATELEASGRALSAKLVDGSPGRRGGVEAEGRTARSADARTRGSPPTRRLVVTLLDRPHWPALIRVVTDRAWRMPRIAALGADARSLFELVERAGELHADDAPLTGKALTAARRALEDALLVHARSEHTEHGHHAAVLSSWSRWCPPDVAKAARAMERAAAEAALATVLGGPLR